MNQEGWKHINQFKKKKKTLMRCNSLVIMSLKLKLSEILEDSLVAVTLSLTKIKMNKRFQTLVCQVCWSKKKLQGR